MATEAVVTVFPPFAVTGRAVAAIEALGGAVRVDVEPGGCCGTTYTFALVPDPAASTADAMYGCPGAWLLVSAAAGEVLTGATLDHGERLRPPRFRVLNNPGTPHVCPCKRSFGEPWPGPGQPSCRSYLPMPWDEDYQPPMRWQRQTGYRLPEE